MSTGNHVLFAPNHFKSLIHGPVQFDWPGDDYLEDFFSTVEEMREAIQIMKSKSVAMKKLTADLLLQTDNAKLEKEKELDILVADVKKVVKHNYSMHVCMYSKWFFSLGRG